MIFCWSC